jgi:hypothetical protein
MRRKFSASTESGLRAWILANTASAGMNNTAPPEVVPTVMMYWLAMD